MKGRRAVAGVVPLFSCRGYTSQSEVWGAAQRRSGCSCSTTGSASRATATRTCPRGAREEWLVCEHPTHGWDTRLDVRRLALSWDQVQQYSPPPNPAKSTDARYRKYADEYGHESWELDALEPTVLGQLVRDEIDAILDHDRWDAALEPENAGAARLEEVSKRWPEIGGLVGEAGRAPPVPSSGFSGPRI